MYYYQNLCYVGNCWTHFEKKTRRGTKSEKIEAESCMRESVAKKMLRVEDYQKIRTLHQLYLFVSSALFSSENETIESEDRLECVVHAVPSNVAFFAWLKIQKLVGDSVADEELAADHEEGP